MEKDKAKMPAVDAAQADVYYPKKSGAGNTLLPQINYVLQGQIWLNNFIVDYYTDYLCKATH